MTIPAGLLDDLRGQAERYAAMVGIAEATLAELRIRPLDEALTLLDRKRRLLAEISAIDARLAPVRADWDDIRARLDASERSEVESALTQVRETLARLIDLENRTAGLLVPPDPALRSKLAAGRLRGAYGGGVA